MQSDILSACVLPTPPDVATVQLVTKTEVFEVDDDGSFHAMVDFNGYVIVERRPHSSSEWDDDDRQHSAWTEGGWDWRLRLSEDIDAAQLAAIRAQLAEAPPESA